MYNESDYLFDWVGRFQILLQNDAEKMRIDADPDRKKNVKEKFGKVAQKYHEKFLWTNTLSFNLSRYSWHLRN